MGVESTGGSGPGEPNDQDYVPRNFVNVDGVDVAYQVAGKGPGLVLVHGTGGGADTNWGELLERFTDRWTVVVPDYAGSGQTVDSGGSLELDDLAAQVIGAAEAANATPFDLVGFSLGAVVGAKIAAERPELVKSIVLVGGLASSDDPRFRFAFDLWQRLLQEDRDLFAGLLALTGFSQPALSNFTDDEIADIVADTRETMAPGFDRQIDLDLRLDITEELAKVKAPTLVVGMTRDHMVPVENAHRVHQLVPDSSYAEIDSGHLVIFEKPDELVELARTFLSSTKSSSSGPAPPRLEPQADQKSMKAVVVERPGDPEGLRLRNLAVPQPEPNEVLVDVAAAGVNFLDVYMRRSGATPVLGMEGAGSVVALGDDANGSSVEVGDRVAWVMHPGSYAEQIVVPVDRLIPLPSDIDERTAAACLLQGLTAQYLVEDSYRVGSGDVVLVHAAAGGVGRLLVQLASAAGARVLATVSSDEKAALVRKAGAESVIRYDREDFAAKARELTEGRGVDCVYDSVNRTTFAGSLDAVARRGTVVIFGEASGMADPLPIKTLQEKGSIKLTYSGLMTFIRDRDELVERSRRLFDSVTRSDLELHIDDLLPLARVQEAHRRIEGRLTSGKLLLLPGLEGRE